MTRMAVELTDDQQRTLELIYAPFRNGGVWPEYLYVEKTLYQQLGVDARDFLPTFPAGLIYPEPSFGNFHIQTDQEVALTVAGVARCEGSEEDVRLFIEALRLFVRLEADYLPPPTGGKPLEAGSFELERDLGFSAEQIARVYQLFHTEIGVFGGGGGNPAQWRFQLTPDLRRFAEVAAIDDYLERRIVPRPYSRISAALLNASAAEEPAYVGASGRNYYTVESLLSGGFGSVERVRDDDDNEFALKTLKIDLEDQNALMHEVESLRSVKHENVIRYVDYGIAPEPFLVMELARGGSLRARLDSARQQGAHLPIETVIGWATQMLSGLGAVHEVLIHRDLKPDNVLFDEDTLKIGDFGIARVIDASTRVHTFKGWGTPVYLPPEGWAGPEGPSPVPSYDLYSFGVMLFELLALRPPFEGDRQALSQAHLYQAPPSPQSLRADIPPQLNALVLQLLDKEPTRRGGDTAAVRDALMRIHANLSPVPDGSVLSAPVEAALERLRRGVASLVEQESEAQARQRAHEEEQRRLLETYNAGLELLSQMIDEAVSIVERHIAPLQLGGRREDRGKWLFTLAPSPLQVRLSISQVNPGQFESEMRPGEIIGFGEIQVVAPSQLHGGGRVSDDPRAGANVVMYFRAKTAWVPHLQIVEIENHPLMGRRMRDYEPFFLERSELAEHAVWLWGGAMHVFQSRIQELTVDVLVQWLSRLVP